jgi:hypothetical protein
MVQTSTAKRVVPGEFATVLTAEGFLGNLGHNRGHLMFARIVTILGFVLVGFWGGAMKKISKVGLQNTCPAY